MPNLREVHRTCSCRITDMFFFLRERNSKHAYSIYYSWGFSPKWPQSSFHCQPPDPASSPYKPSDSHRCEIFSWPFKKLLIYFSPPLFTIRSSPVSLPGSPSSTSCVHLPFPPRTCCPRDAPPPLVLPLPPHLALLLVPRAACSTNCANFNGLPSDVKVIEEVIFVFGQITLYTGCLT